MNTLQIRQQLHQRIDNLPDDAIEEIADFTLFIMAKKQMPPLYEEWTTLQWQDFALADAQEIYEKP